MIGTALAVAGGTLAAGLVLAVGARRLPSVRAQLTVLALGAVTLPLAAVLLSGVLMFDSGHDLTILAAACASAAAALVGALLVARGIMEPLRRVRRASEALAGGDLERRAPEDGPRELAELGADFNRMALGLERLFEARRALVMHASHDLRTPLAAIQVMIEAMQDGVAPPERYLPALHEQARHLGALVDDLFELARIDAGALSLELGEVRIGGLVEECVRGVEADAAARGIRLESRVLGEVPAARCAAEQVERVLMNLLANALRHTPSDGAVAVVVERGDDHVRVSVEDTGDGIPEGALERAFERFWRADDARTRDGGAGAGLGLAIARGLVEAQGGRIWAEARTEGGARVSFTLPLPAGAGMAAPAARA